MPSDYDERDERSIVEYASRLQGHTLREMTDAPEHMDPKKRRGSFGNAIEKYYFKYRPNSDSRPDFYDAGLELKTTPVKRGPKGSYVAKERLVLTMIDYMSVVNETFERSHLLAKSSSILLVSYLWSAGLDLLDYPIILVEKWGLPPEDMPQFRQDWETVVSKVRAGHAEDISGSDTLYLEACTKAANSTVRRPQPFSDVPAKPRAWALKASYMTVAENKMLYRRQRIKRGRDERYLSVLQLVRKRFAPYIGLTEGELGLRFGLSRSKDFCARITRHILGVDQDARIDEFEKAGIKPKTIRLQRNGRPKEAMSFPAFDYFELETRSFEDSDFFGYLQQRYLFVIFRLDSTGEYRLSDVLLWQMPETDYPEAKRCYDQMRENVRRGRADVSVKSTENRCCHVRPHGRDSRDVRPQPHGDPVVKKCFWFNQSYIAEEIDRVERSGS